jgi:DNA-binding CsgD family transcriptional regulator
LLVIGYLTGKAAGMDPVELAGALGLSRRVLGEALDELLSAGRVSLSGDQLRLRSGSRPAAEQRSSRAGLEYERWQRWTLASIVPRDLATVAECQVMRGQAAVREELGRLYGGAETEILSVTPRPLVESRPDERNQRALAVIRGAEVSFPSRGVTGVWLSHADHLHDPANREVLHRTLQAGERLHSAPDIVTRMVIVDRKVAVVPIDPTRHGAGALVLRAPDVIVGLLAMFHAMVEGARRLQADVFVSPTEHEVLRLLAAGSKDEAIARELEVSARTVRRVISGLLDRSGAESRFQLALHALQVGWLTAADVSTDPVRRRAPQVWGPVDRLP